MTRTLHIITGPDGDKLTIKVEGVRGRVFEATVPRDIQPLELSAFLEQVRQVVIRRWRGETPA
jgi:hypothetical protein